MAAQQLPQLSQEFRTSYDDHARYPQNLMHKASYKGVLRAYESRIETAQPRFLTQALDDIDVRFRDWDAPNSSMLVAFRSTMRY
jgi:hypothetical protein